MHNPETLATMSTHDTGRKQSQLRIISAIFMTRTILRKKNSSRLKSDPKGSIDGYINCQT